MQRYCFERRMKLTSESRAEKTWKPLPAAQALGEACMAVGKYADAEQQFNLALETREKPLGANDLTVAHTLRSKGLLLSIQGKYLQSKDLLERVVQIDRETLGPNDSGLAAALNALAIVDAELGDKRTAQKLYEQALAIDEKNLGRKALMWRRFLPISQGFIVPKGSARRRINCSRAL